MHWQHRSESDPPSIADIPEPWAAALERPKLRSSGFDSERGPEFRIDDLRATNEVARILRHKSCAICRSSMAPCDTQVYGDEIFVCCTCGYWGGVGSREWNSHMTPPMRAAIGRYRPIAPLDAATTDMLATHLRRAPGDLTTISPKRAERFVMDLLSDALECEVRAVGKPQDGGVDGYVIRSDTVRSIVQVKWRRDTAKAESVSIVREVAGTLLAQGIPDGIIVSTRDHFSPNAVRTAETIEHRVIAGLGRLRLQLVDYHLIMDMLEITTRKLTAGLRAEDWFPMEAHDKCCVFDGASRLTIKDV